MSKQTMIKKTNGLEHPVKSSNQLIKLNGLGKTYNSGSNSFKALDNINLTIHTSEFIAVVGKSGSGKTTLLNLLTGIDNPTTGEIHIGGEAIHQMSQQELSRWRGKNVGVIFQFFQLLPTLTVQENVMLPMDFCNLYERTFRKERALLLLSKVGIIDQANKFPSELSGGQQQRAAIARALANDPKIICADEPTGNLDTHTSDAVLDLFQQLNSEGKTIIMVTHERDIQQYSNREIVLEDGKVKNLQEVPNG